MPIPSQNKYKGLSRRETDTIKTVLGRLNNDYERRGDSTFVCFVRNNRTKKNYEILVCRYNGILNKDKGGRFILPKNPILDL